MRKINEDLGWNVQKIKDRGFEWFSEVLIPGYVKNGYESISKAEIKKLFEKLTGDKVESKKNNDK